MRTYRSVPPVHGTAGVEPAGIFAAFLSTFFLTLTNPMTILAFAALFAGLGVGVGTDRVGTVIFVAGVFAGSALWWAFLSGTVVLARGSLTPGSMRWVNRFAGMIILGFGVYALVSTVTASLT